MRKLVMMGYADVIADAIEEMRYVAESIVQDAEDGITIAELYDELKDACRERYVSEVALSLLKIEEIPRLLQVRVTGISGSYYCGKYNDVFAMTDDSALAIKGIAELNDSQTRFTFDVDALVANVAYMVSDRVDLSDYVRVDSPWMAGIYPDKV